MPVASGWTDCSSRMWRSMVMMGEGSAWSAMAPPFSLWFLGGNLKVARFRPAFKFGTALSFQSGLGYNRGQTVPGDGVEPKKASFHLSLVAGVLILGLSVFGFVGLLGRPEIPRQALSRATGITHDLLAGGVLRADGFEVRDRDLDFKFIAAHHRIGGPIEFVVAKDGRELSVTEPLVPFYGKSSA